MSLLNIFQNYFCLFVNFTFFFSLFYFNYFRFFVGCNIKSAIWNILNCSRPLGLKIFLHASDNSSFKTTSEFLNIVLIVINLLWGFIIINDRHSLCFLQNVYYCVLSFDWINLSSSPSFITKIVYWTLFNLS